MYEKPNLIFSKIEIFFVLSFKLTILFMKEFLHKTAES